MTQISASRLGSQPPCSNHSFEAQIQALNPWDSNKTERLKSQPLGSNSSLDVQIYATLFKSKLIFKPTIGHWLLWARCPSYFHILTNANLGTIDTADHLPLLQLFSLSPFWAATPKGTSSLRHGRFSRCLYIHLLVSSSVCTNVVTRDMIFVVVVVDVVNTNSPVRCVQSWV